MRKNFSLTPKGIIESLNLRRPIFQKTAAYGHFGRTEPEFTWEATDKAAKLAEQAGVAVAGEVARCGVSEGSEGSESESRSDPHPSLFSLLSLSSLAFLADPRHDSLSRAPMP